MATTQRARVTADQFLALPELVEVPAELIDGEVIELTPSPGWGHQWTVKSLIFALESWRRVAPRRGAAAVAPLDIVLDVQNVVQPDVAWWAEARVPPPRTSPVTTPPDLAIEIFSPSTRARDEGVKRDLYARAGVAELWLVDPDARTVRRLARSAPGSNAFDVEAVVPAGATLMTPLLPGFALDPCDLFDDRPPAEGPVRP